MNVWHGRWIGRRVLCTLLMVACGASSAIALSPQTAGAGTPRSGCSAADTQVWVGIGDGGGFAGGYVVPLEFSNVGRRSCTLYGYPGVSAVRGMRQTGPAAKRMVESHSVVTLAAGATAHAALKVTDTGALCGSGAVSADGLQVYAPGQRAAKWISMALKVCAGRATLAIGALHAGVGVPGYTTQ